MQKIKTVCVIGAGVMGSGIAAQIANSHTKVILLDIADKNSTNKNQIVINGYNKLFIQQPPPLAHPDHAKYITLGNLKENLSLIKEADLIIEAIVEKIEIKHSLYNLITPYIKQGAILASNTSTLSLLKLKEELPINIRKHFVITHFFNPPRYMELVELIKDAETSEDIITALSYFLVRIMGKTIVNCNDTPGFIANRIGCFLLESVARKGIEENLNPAIIDYIFSAYFGFPSTGIFGLYDLIGHDVMNLIANSLLQSLPKNDEYHKIYIQTDVLDQMLNKNFIGRKAGGGFYKISRNSGGKTLKQLIDFKDLSYRNMPKLPIYKNMEEFLNCGDEYSKFITKVLKALFSYSISLIPDVTADPHDIDKAMKLGYNLKYGPFELLDRMPWGSSWLARQGIDNKIPPVTEKSNDININNIALLSNDSSELIYLDKNYIFKIKSKMNALDIDIFNLLIEAIHYCETRDKELYIFPEGNNFSAGANLRYLKSLIENKKFKEIEKFLTLGQEAMLGLKYAKIPVISCAIGSALGGGCELLLHSDFVIANQNLNAGLVELGVGLIPAFGGTKEMFMRSYGNKDKLLQNLKNILTKHKSSSAEYFKLDYGVECDVNMNKNFILQQAFTNKYKKKISKNRDIKLPKIELNCEIEHKKFDELQLDILNFFQVIIDKKFVTEQELLDFEKEKFLELASKPSTIQKMSKFV